MAKNIIITPSPGGGTLPSIDFQGATTGTIKLEVRDDGSLLISGATETNVLSLYDETANPVRVPSISLEDSNASHHLKIIAGSDLSANRTLTLSTGDAARTLDISAADVTISSFGATIVDDADAAAVRTTLGLVIGTNVQAYDADLTTWASLTPSAFFQTLVDDVDASTARGTLGLGTSATVNTGTSGATIPLLNGANTWSTTQTFTVAPVFTDASGTRTALGLVIGTDVQAYDADLATWAGLTPSAFFQTLVDDADASTARATLGLTIGTHVQAYDADLTTWAGLTPSAFFQTLVDDADASAARTTLGLGTSATVNTGTSGTVIPLLDGNNTWSGTANVFQFANLIWASNNTDDTNKSLRLLSRNYDTSVESEGFTVLASDITTSAHVISIGGVDASYNAATQLDFYTAANVSTRTGTLRMRITSAGVIQDGSGNTVWTAGNDGSGSGLDADIIRGTTPTAFGLSLIDDAAATNARTTLGLVIGTDVAAAGTNTDLTSVYLNNTGLKIKDTNASHGLIIAPGSDLTVDRTLTITTGDAARTLDISAGSVTISSFGASLIDDAAATNARTTLGLVIGTNVAAAGANTDITTIYLNNTGLKVKDTDASHGLSIVPGSNLTADRTFTLTTGDAARTLDISAASVTISSYGATLVDDADASTARTTLGLGTVATQATGTSGATIPFLNGTNTWANTQTFTVAPVFTDQSGSRTALGLGTIATQSAASVSITGGSITGITDLAVADGGTGASSASAAWTNLTLVGPDQLWVPASYLKPRTTNGCAALATTETTTNKVNIETLDFDASTAEYAQFTIRVPKRYSTNTVTAKFHWKHASTTTNFAVVWGIQAGAFGDNEALDTAFGTAQTVTDTGGTTNNHYISAATSAMTIANLTAEENVYFQVYRDATSGSDTLAIDAGLIGVLLQFTTAAPTDT